jgi:hypothetical protein
MGMDPMPPLSHLDMKIGDPIDDRHSAFPRQLRERGYANITVSILFDDPLHQGIDAPLRNCRSAAVGRAQARQQRSAADRRELFPYFDRRERRVS